MSRKRIKNHHFLVNMTHHVVMQSSCRQQTIQNLYKKLSLYSMFQIIDSVFNKQLYS